jgi:hypothetical protein
MYFTLHSTGYFVYFAYTYYVLRIKREKRTRLNTRMHGLVSGLRVDRSACDLSVWSDRPPRHPRLHPKDRARVVEHWKL